MVMLMALSSIRAGTGPQKNNHESQKIDDDRQSSGQRQAVEQQKDEQARAGRYAAKRGRRHGRLHGKYGQDAAAPQSDMQQITGDAILCEKLRKHSGGPQGQFGQQGDFSAQENGRRGEFLLKHAFYVFPAAHRLIGDMMVDRVGGLQVGRLRSIRGIERFYQLAENFLGATRLTSKKLRDQDGRLYASATVFVAGRLCLQ